jgi:hypothetical protein
MNQIELTLIRRIEKAKNGNLVIKSQQKVINTFEMAVFEAIDEPD